MPRADIQTGRIGLGCATFGREIDQAASFAVADRALERGITMFDTAESYANGESERVLGRWVRDRGVRDRVTIATKVTAPLSQARILTTAEASLRNLGIERIDLYYLHVYPGDDRLEESLHALDALVRDGKVRRIGCSNFTHNQLRHALALQDRRGWARMRAIQPRYNLVDRDIERQTLPLCRREDIAVIAYSPLGAGFLTGKYRRDGAIPSGSRFDINPEHQQVYFHEEKWKIMERLREQSQATGAPMTRLALAWVLQQTAIATVLIGGRCPEQVDQAFDAGRVAVAVVDELAGLWA